MIWASSGTRLDRLAVVRGDCEIGCRLDAGLLTRRLGCLYMLGNSPSEPHDRMRNVKKMTVRYKKTERRERPRHGLEDEAAYGSCFESCFVSYIGSWGFRL